jgi:hypothetical protein
MSGTTPALDRRRGLLARLGRRRRRAARLAAGPAGGGGRRRPWRDPHHLFAPASAADVEGFLGTSVAAARPALPADLVPVALEGRARSGPSGGNASCTRPLPGAGRHRSP